MAHGITDSDSLFSYRARPWHGLGAILERRPNDIGEALELSGLAWQVDQLSVQIGPDSVTAQGYLANVRADTGAVLGIVSEDYHVVQNLEAFQFLSELIGSELHFETAGSLWGGKAVWVLAEVPDHIEVGGDRVRQFVLVTTRHDGTASVRAKVTPIRVVCNNTLSAALAGSKAGTYKVRHLGGASVKLHEARAVLEMTVDYGRQFARLGDRLATEAFTAGQLELVLAELDPGDGSARRMRNAGRRRQAVLGLFSGGETVGNAPGTRWAAWNAIVEHYQHDRPARSDQGRFVRAFEDPAGFSSRALELVQAA